MSPSLNGLLGVVLTCFDEQGRLDETAFRTEFSFCQETHCDGLVLCGSTGEFPYLNEGDYRAVLAIGAEMHQGNSTLIAGTSGMTERCVLAQMETARALGYAHVLVCPPYYFPQNSTDVLAFYRVISNHAPDGMSIILYNIPFCTTGIALSILPQLADMKNIIGMKDSSGDMLYFAKAHQVIKERGGVLFTGQDLTLLPSLALGADGCMSSATWILSKAIRGLYDSFHKDDILGAQRYHRYLSAILQKLDYIPFPENYRALANVCGVYCGKPQRAFTNLSGPGFEQWKKEVKTLLTGAETAPLYPCQF